MSLGCGVGVIRTWLVSLGCSVGIIRMRCQSHQDMVSESLVSSGCGVRVIGIWCWYHWGVVSVLVSSGGKGPYHGHLHVACLTVILEMLIRCDTICKCEGQQENGEHTNRKSTMMKQWPVGAIYCWSVESWTHLKTGGKRGGRCCLPLARPGKQQTIWWWRRKKSDVVCICVMLEWQLLRHCALARPSACHQHSLRCNKWGGKELRPRVKEVEDEADEEMAAWHVWHASGQCWGYSLSVAVDMHKTKFGLPNKTLSRKMVLLMWEE